MLCSQADGAIYGRRDESRVVNMMVVKLVLASMQSRPEVWSSARLADNVKHIHTKTMLAVQRLPPLTSERALASLTQVILNLVYSNVVKVYHSSLCSS